MLMGKHADNQMDNGGSCEGTTVKEGALTCSELVLCCLQR